MLPVREPQTLIPNISLESTRYGRKRLAARHDGNRRHEPSTPVYAFAFNNGSVNGGNPYIGALERLREAAPDRDKNKYDRTLAFIQKHTRRNSPHAA